MPRTKHAIVGLGLLLLLFVGMAGASFMPVPLNPFETARNQQATAIDSNERTPEVVVVHDTTREDARALLRERLKEFLNDTSPAQMSEEVPETRETGVSSQPDSESVSAPKSIRCDPDAVPRSTMDWGPVNITIAEGARVIRSLALGTDGLPLHIIQLSSSPTVTGVTACLPNGPIAILLDGTVVTPGELVNTDTEGLLGYAIDGFPLFSPYEDGSVMTSADLDICHGHTHEIIDQGTLTSLYHYHATEDEPYTLGCFRGSPVFE